jgi:hypothetical protein
VDIEAEPIRAQNVQAPDQVGRESAGREGVPRVVRERPEWEREQVAKDEVCMQPQPAAPACGSEVVDEEEPRHNQCFSPLPTVSPSADRLAMEMSPLSVEHVEKLLQEHCQNVLAQRQPAREDTPAAAHVDKRPQVWRKNQDVLMPQGREAASTVVGGILALAAGALSRPVAAPWQWWGICLLAVSNLSAGVLIGFQLARRASCLVQEGARKR